MEKFKESKFATPVTVAILVLVGVVFYYEMRGIFGQSQAAADADDRIFICSETGKSFHMKLSSLQGQSVPIESPYSGKKTGYPAELCYWTADGQIKKDPTPVLLNSWIEKTGPTFCPDCGRLVVPHNPMAIAGHAPPPTQAEWAARHSALK